LRPESFFLCAFFHTPRQLHDIINIQNVNGRTGSVLSINQQAVCYLSRYSYSTVYDPNAIFTMEIAQLPGSEDLTVGQQVYLSNQYGQPFPVKVTAKDEKNITFDANHEMAGKELNFTIELVDVK